MQGSRTLLLVLLVGCSSHAPPPSREPAREPAHAEAHGDAAMPPEIVTFHDAMSPLWHAEKGEQRMTDTCAANPELSLRAEAIAKLPAPPAAGDRWPAATKQLVDATVDLRDACDNPTLAAFEPVFERVHASFHAVAEMAGGEHHEHHEEHH